MHANTTLTAARPSSPLTAHHCTPHHRTELNAYRPKPRNNTGVNLLSENPVDVPKVRRPWGWGRGLVGWCVSVGFPEDPVVVG